MRSAGLASMISRQNLNAGQPRVRRTERSLNPQMSARRTAVNRFSIRYFSPFYRRTYSDGPANRPPADGAAKAEARATPPPSPRLPAISCDQHWGQELGADWPLASMLKPPPHRGIAHRGRKQFGEQRAISAEHARAEAGPTNTATPINARPAPPASPPEKGNREQADCLISEKTEKRHPIASAM